MEWVSAGMPYCQCPYGSCDSHVCCGAGYRPENPAWDAYRSDCSGLVSWAWGLPAPGAVTGGLAPFSGKWSHVIDASELKPGDALNNDEHVVLFAAWLGPNKMRVIAESDWGKLANVSDINVWTSGSTVHWYKDFTAIRGNAISETCTPHCQGNSLIATSCGATDCGASQGSCVDDSLGPRCVYYACPAKGDVTVCAPDKPHLVTCHDGAASANVDCAASGSVCVKDNAHCDHPPQGYLDSASCTTVAGWAEDKDAADKALEVHVDFGAKEGEPSAVAISLPADGHRDDLCGAIGSCNHGFSLRAPRSLLDGAPHAVHAYALDATGGPEVELGSSPRTLGCGPLAAPDRTMLRRVVDATSFTAWKFSDFWDVAPLDTELARTDSPSGDAGPDFPSNPLVVARSDGTPGLWLVDRGTRRHVPDEATRAAWRLGSPQKWPSDKIDALVHGPDLPPFPALVRTLGPTIFVVDAPQPNDGKATPMGTSPGQLTIQPVAVSPSPSSSSKAPAAGATAPTDAETGASCTVAAPRGSSPGLFVLGFAAVAVTALRRRRERLAAITSAGIAIAAAACASSGDPSSTDDTPAITTPTSSASTSASAPPSAAPTTSAKPMSGTTQWSKHVSGGGDRSATASAVDANGNVYLTGSFTGTLELGGTPLSSEGDWTSTNADRAIFVAKLGGDGTHVWSMRVSGAGSGTPQAVAVDAKGNVLVAGGLSGTLRFGTTELTSAGGNDAFVAKLDASGNIVWAKSWGDAADQIANAIAVDAKGNIFVTGALEGSMDLGGSKPLTSAGGSDVFVLALDGTGKPAFAGAFGDGATQIGYGVAVDAKGDVLVTGAFGGQIDFGGGALKSAGGLDVFVAKLDATGKQLWSKRYGDKSDQLARAIAVDASGHVALTGEFGGELDFGAVKAVGAGGGGAGGSGGSAGSGGGSAGKGGSSAGNGGSAGKAGGSAGTGGSGGDGGAASTSFASVGAMDLFVAKLDTDGASLFAHGFGDLDDQRGLGVAFDASGNVVITGDAPGGLDLGGGKLPAGHVFVASFDALGKHRWSHRYGPGAGQGYWLAVGSGGVFVTGVFSGTVDFGSGSMAENGHIGAFLARVTP